MLVLYREKLPQRNQNLGSRLKADGISINYPIFLAILPSQTKIIRLQFLSFGVQMGFSDSGKEGQKYFLSVFLDAISNQYFLMETQ